MKSDVFISVTSVEDNHLATSSDDHLSTSDDEVLIKKSEKKHPRDLHFASVSFQSYYEICMLFLCLISLVYGNNSFSIGLISWYS